MIVYNTHEVYIFYTFAQRIVFVWVIYALDSGRSKTNMSVLQLSSSVIDLTGSITIAPLFS